MQLLIEEVEIGAEYQDVIHNFWVTAKMNDQNRISIFDYNCFDLRNKRLTSVECLLYANLDTSSESFISGTYIGRIQICDWEHLADDLNKEKKYSVLKTTNGIILFNEEELIRELTEEETLSLHVARYDLVGIK